MLTYNRIELFQFKFLWFSTFVLRGGIEVTCTSRGNQLDLLTNTLAMIQFLSTLSTSHHGHACRLTPYQCPFYQ